MRYIICEDNKSGFYFWTFISKFALNKDYQLVSANIINKALNKSGDAIGITKIHDYLDYLIKNKNYNKNDTYILCIDNSSDSIVSDTIDKIDSWIADLDNFHRLEYICFEQLIINSPNVLQFFPNLINYTIFNILKQHAQRYGLGHSRQLEITLRKNNIKFSTTERIYNELLEKVLVVREQKVGKRNYDILVHNYILKGGWSVCWTTDCTPDCPNDKCWEATGENNLMCKNCNLQFKNKDQSCVLVNNTNIRKFAEEDNCNKNLPPKLKDRFQLMFSIPEILNIDNY